MNTQKNLKLFTDGLKQKLKKGAIMSKTKKEAIIVEFRAKMKDEGRTLKWFHAKHVVLEIPKLSYTNFIRKINIAGEMTEALSGVIKKFLESA